MNRQHLSSRRGSALILVFWSLLLIGMAVFGVVEMVELSIDHTSHEEQAVEARGLALSGVALGLNPHQALSLAVENLSLTRLERHGADWRLLSLNEQIST